MIRAIPLVYELLSLLIGLPLLASIANFVTNPPYFARIRQNSGGKISVHIERRLRFFSSKLGELDPDNDEFEDDLNAVVSKAESRVAALNCTRRSLIPRRRPLSHRLKGA